MKKELVSLKLFKGYASFLLNKHLDGLIAADLKRSFEVKLPLLKFFSHLSEKQLYEISKKSIVEYLDSIIQETVFQTIEKSIASWVADRLPGIPRDQLSASDISLIYNVRKHSLLSFLPKYSADPEMIVAIMKEIEDFYTFQESIAFNTFALIHKEQIVRSESRLKEAQAIAKLGFWDFDYVEGIVNWSEELYLIYGLRKEGKISAEVIGQHIVKEDVPALMEKVKQAHDHGTPFTHEYRIIRTDGSIRYLADKGYAVTQPDGKVLVKGISQDITENRLIKSELEHRSMLLQEAQEIAHLGSWEWDTTLNKVSWSDEMYRLFGLEPGEIDLDFQKYMELVYPDDKVLLNQYISNCFIKHEPYVVEHRILHKNGSIRWLQAKGKVTLADGERVLRMAGVAMDMTVRKEARDKLQKSEALLLETQEIANVGSYEWDIRTGVSLVTPEIKRIFGHSPEEESNFEQFGEVVHPDDAEKVFYAMENAFQKQIPYECEYRIIRQSDKALRYVLSKGKITFNEENKPIKMVGSVMDISERKLIDETLKVQTEALLASNKELEAFCYTVSHDLRSPLRAIDGFGKMLAVKYTHVLDPEGQRLLHVVRTNAQRMGLLIDSLLDFSRLNRREIKKHTLSMQDLVSRVIEECKEQDPALNTTFRVQVNDAPADRELMHMVWQNLISNAIKFSSDKKNPFVEIGSEYKDHQWVFYVKDNGSGFDMKYQDKLFGVFQRLHPADEFPGTGVGLATVQRIVHRHGGNVWATGEPGVGATFYFTLPPSV